MFSRNPMLLAALAMAGTGLTSARLVSASSPGADRSPRSSRPRVVHAARGGLSPHQNEREIARRLRQSARDEQRQRERASNLRILTSGQRPERVSRRLRWMA